MADLGPFRPCPRENLTTGLVLIAPDGETVRGRVVSVRHTTQVLYEAGERNGEPLIMACEYSGADPAPIVADPLTGHVESDEAPQ